MGRMSTPGWSAGTRISDSPRCFGASGSVRHSTYNQSARVPNVIQIFCPFSTHSSPSRTARVRTPPRSEPASGSLKPWPHMSSQRMMRGRKRAFCSSLPACSNVGPKRSRPCTPTQYGARARKCSSRNTSSSSSVPPRPPYSTGHVMPSQPPSASSRSHARRSSHHESSVGPPTPGWRANSPVRCSANQSRISSRRSAWIGVSARFTR